MKEIKSRGKVLYNGNHYFSGDWVYGYYYKDIQGKSFIVDTEEDMFGHAGFKHVEVDPETVSLFIGILDKDRKREIYSGDTVRAFYCSLDTGEEITKEELEEERRLDADEHARAVGCTLSPESDFSWPYFPGKYKVVSLDYGFLLESLDMQDDIPISIDYFQDERLEIKIIED